MELLAAIGWTIVPRIPVFPGVEVSPHGIGIAVGYLLGTALFARRAQRWLGVSREHVWNFMTWGVIGVIVGARLFYVVGHYGEVTANGGFVNIFKLTYGGVVLYGGIFGALVGVFPYIRKHKLPYFRLLDHAVISIALGIAIGRIGDLMIGDHLGGPTNFFLGYRYGGSVSDLGPPGCPAVPPVGPVGPPVGFRNGDLYCPAVGEVVHQAALYDFIGALLLFPLLLWLGRRARRTGFLATVATGFYASVRLAFDFTRTTTETYLGLRGTQWVSVTLLVVATIALIRMSRTPAPVAPEHGGAPLGYGDAGEGADLMVSEGGPPPPEPAGGPPAHPPSS